MKYYIKKYQTPSGSLNPEYLLYLKDKNHPTSTNLGELKEKETALDGTWLGNIFDKVYNWSNKNYNDGLKGSFARGVESVRNLYENVRDGGFGFLPYVGDAVDVVSIGDDVNKGNYGSAALTASLMVLPGSAGKAKQLGKKFLNKLDVPGIKPSKLTEAERLGLPKGERYTYMNLEDLNLFKNQVNEFAKSNKYPTFNKVEFSLHELERFARDMINRHNSFYRGVLMPWKNSDLEIIYNKLGPNATLEEILQYVATHPKSNPGTLFITPYPTNGYGLLAIIQRPYKLGNDRLKWIEEGDFIIRNGNIERLLPNNELYIINPWNETGKPNSYINDELLTTQPMIFRGWANSDATQLSNNLKNFKQGGSIHIKEKNKGKFTESAKRAGKSVQEHARDVVNNPKATKLQKKRALFALNSKQWSKK